MTEVVEKKLDMKETNELVLFLFKTGKTVKMAKENDGKIDVNDIVLLVPLMSDIGPAIEGADKIIDEIKDMDEQESKDLIDLVAKETGEVLTGKAELVDKIIKGLKFAQAGYEFYKAF